MAALLQRIDEALEGAALGDWQVGTIIQASGLHEYDVYEEEMGMDGNSMALCYEQRVAEFIAAAPQLLRECAALLRGLDDGAVGELREQWESCRNIEYDGRDGLTQREELYMMRNEADTAADYIAAIEADNVRLREALAAAEAELRQYREPM